MSDIPSTEEEELLYCKFVNFNDGAIIIFS